MTRKQLDDQMLGLRDQVHHMAHTVRDMVLDAAESVITSDHELAESVINRDVVVDQSQVDIMLSLFDLIVLQQPVSSDARFCISTVAIVSELEQAGDDAVNLARRAIKTSAVFPAEMAAPLGALAESAVQMLEEVMGLYDGYDSAKCAQIIANDSAIDSAYKQARRQILDEDSQAPLNRQTLRIVQIFHALEHVADRSVEIAKKLRAFNDGVQVPA